MYSYFVGPELTVKRFSVKGGPLFASINDVEQGLCKCNEGATREVNQRGRPSRGFGTSLVYYNMYFDSSRVPGYFFEASVNVHRWVSVLAGASQKNVDVMVETGYDRFDRLEEYETRDVGRVGIRDSYAGIEFQVRGDGKNVVTIGGFQVLAGRMRDESLTLDGMVLSANWLWYMNLGIAFHISSR